jgi:hypothetical protein
MVAEVGHDEEGQCGGEKGSFLDRFLDDAGFVLSTDIGYPF